MFRLTRSVLSLALLAGGLAVTTAATPAAATGTIGRHRAESGHGTKPDKSATADCPDGQTVIGAGGRIEDNDGTVILTGVVPTATTVTATAAALPDQPAAAWSVVAVAVCAPHDVLTASTASTGPTAPTAVPGGPAGSTISTASSTADCPGTEVLSGTGFALSGAVGEELLTGLVPDVVANRVTATVTVRAPGLAPPTAYAICVPRPASPEYSARVEGSSATDTTAPKTATAAGSPNGTVAQVFGVGGLVSAGVSDVYLDVLVPDPGLLSGTAGASKLAGGTDPHAWSVTAYGCDVYYY